MKVRYSPLALLQLDEIHRYIAQYNPRVAKEVVARIEELCETLGEFPGMGSVTDQPDVRVLPVVRYPYLIFYLPMVDADEVRIPSHQAWPTQTAASGRDIALISCAWTFLRGALPPGPSNRGRRATPSRYSPSDLFHPGPHGAE